MYISGLDIKNSPLLDMYCIFNCGHCKHGVPHHCRSCGAINQHRTNNCPRTNVSVPHHSHIQNVTVTIVVGHKVLTCYRGVHDTNYEKPFGPGGRIDHGETCEQAAVRETKEETGITLSRSNLRFYSDTGNRRNYIVTMHQLPLNFAPSARHAGEMIQTSFILGVPTSVSQGSCRWALVPINIVTGADQSSPFVRMIKNMKNNGAL